ncbi:hypothetical protein OL67_001348 [Phaeobacter piscinae]|nr:hypothetical protein OL67_001348 [Phaeobacter piscinae]
MSTRFQCGTRINKSQSGLKTGPHFYVGLFNRLVTERRGDVLPARTFQKIAQAVADLTTALSAFAMWLISPIASIRLSTPLPP